MRKIEILSEAEVDALVAACSTRYPTGRRNRALLLVMAQSGLRIAETLALLPQDVENDCIRIHRGKGHKRRTAPLSAGTAAALDAWLLDKAQRQIEGPIFSTLRGGEISQDYVRGLLARLRKKAGIAKRIHCHGLRHSAASWWQRRGVNVRDIQLALGHSSLATTERYLRNLDPHDVIARMNSLLTADDTTSSS